MAADGSRRGDAALWLFWPRGGHALQCQLSDVNELRVAAHWSFSGR